MNRRKFIASLFILGGGVAATYYGGKYIKSISTPDLAKLDEKAGLIADLAEVIIPETDSLGAKEARVHEYIIHMIKHNADRKVSNNFMDGITDVETYALSEYNLPFVKLNKQQQIDVVTYFKNEDENFSGNLGKLKNKVFGKSFFSILKEYTCIGYCTSMAGITKGLAYDPIPGHYITTNYVKGQKSWATK